MSFSNSKIKSNILLPLALIYLFFGGGVPSGLAFCFGYDGHIAFEVFNVTGDCASSIESNHLTTNQVRHYENDSHCGVCFDVVPVISRSTAAFKIDTSLFSYPISLFLSEMCCNGDPVSKVLFSPATFPATSHLVSIRTTILLI
jgi:hypothetical protein